MFVVGDAVVTRCPEGPKRLYRQTTIHVTERARRIRRLSAS